MQLTFLYHSVILLVILILPVRYRDYVTVILGLTVDPISAAVTMFVLETEPMFKPHFSKRWDPTVHPAGTAPRCAFILFYSNALIMLFFTGDVLARLLTWPGNITMFWRDIFNVLDVLSLLPFYIQIIELSIGQDREESAEYIVLRVLRIFRVVRIFKFIRHSRDLMIIIKAVTSARKELGILVILMVIFIVTFGSVMFYIESGVVMSDGSANPFTSILASCWWVIVTVTTVGYGDMYPRSVWGKVFGSVVLALGIVALALPMTIIVTKFSLVYDREKPAVGKH